ncbi:MAG: CDP-alcohol phosphatidyltransferase family protein [Acutalibacteraceae bacterium]
MTVSRLVAALLLLFTDTFSVLFFVLYIYGGISDMIDGRIAGYTGFESKTGERLDSIADFVFIAVCLFKILPIFSVPLWIWIMIGVIAMIKIVNLISGYVCRREILFLHTTANRITGFLLFLMPLTLNFIPISYTAAIVGTVAAFAAIQEGHFIRINK